jgi:hypothetical protein
MRVTEVQGARLVSLDGMPAVDAIGDYAQETGQAFDRADALPFFLHNILGIREGDTYRLRGPLVGRALDLLDAVVALQQIHRTGNLIDDLHDDDRMRSRPFHQVFDRARD